MAPWVGSAVSFSHAGRDAVNAGATGAEVGESRTPAQEVRHAAVPRDRRRGDLSPADGVGAAMALGRRRRGGEAARTPRAPRAVRGLGRGRKTRRVISKGGAGPARRINETLADWLGVRISPMFGRWGYFVGPRLFACFPIKE